MNICQFVHQPFLNLHCQVFIKEGDEDEDMILIEEGIAIVYSDLIRGCREDVGVHGGSWRQLGGKPCSCLGFNGPMVVRITWNLIVFEFQSAYYDVQHIYLERNDERYLLCGIESFISSFTLYLVEIVCFKEASAIQTWTWCQSGACCEYQVIFCWRIWPLLSRPTSC